MQRHAHSSGYLAPAALLMVAASILYAQDAAPIEDPGTAERGVARISIAGGEVSVRRGDSGDWVAAVVNAPLMVEDRVSTGTGSRAEVQFDSANLVRIGANAEIRLAELGANHYHLQAAHGTVTFRVLRESHAQVEVDTPTVSVRPSHIGVYRIYVQGDGQTEITVRLGAVDVSTPRGVEQLQAGQTMLARGDPDDPEFRIVPAIALDAWDRWNEQRDREMLSSPSYSNVPQDMAGGEDLDNYGQWVDEPSYGQVWSPQVDPDWAIATISALVVDLSTKDVIALRARAPSWPPSGRPFSSCRLPGRRRPIWRNTQTRSHCWCVATRLTRACRSI